MRTMCKKQYYFCFYKRAFKKRDFRFVPSYKLNLVSLHSFFLSSASQVLHYVIPLSSSTFCNMHTECSDIPDYHASFHSSSLLTFFRSIGLCVKVEHNFLNNFCLIMWGCFWKLVMKSPIIGITHSNILRINTSKSCL